MPQETRFKVRTRPEEIMNKMVFVFLPVTLCVWLPSPTTPPSSQVKPLRGPLSSQNPDLLFFFFFLNHGQHLIGKKYLALQAPAYLEYIVVFPWNSNLVTSKEHLPSNPEN